MKSKISHTESGNDAGLLQKDAERNAVLVRMNRRFVSAYPKNGVGKGCSGLTSCHIVGFGTAFAIMEMELSDIEE